MGKETTTLDTLHMDNLDGFNWDADVEEVDFFGEVTKRPEEVAKDKDKGEESPKVDEKKPGKDQEEEDDEDKDAPNPFKSFENGEEPDEIVKTEKVKTGDEEDKEDKTVVADLDSQSLAVLSFLKGENALEITDEELKDIEGLDEEDRKEVLKDYFQQAVEDRFAESIQDLPETVKNIVKYVAKGGDLSTFLSTMMNSSSGLSENLDIAEESNQELVVRNGLQEEGYDSDYIDSQIDYLKDSGKLQITAEKRFEKWTKAREEAQKKEVARVEAQKKQQREAQITFKRELTEQVKSNEEIKGFKLSKKDVSEIPDYISSQSVKLEDGRAISPFYRDLNKAMQDKDKLVLLAKLLRDDFDFTPLQKNIDTKRTKELKNNLQRQKDTQSIKSSAGSSQTPKRLIDMLD